MAAVASIVIEVDEKGAVTSLQHFDGEMRKVESGLRRAGSTGNVVMTEMARQHRQANDAAQLLGRTLGVQLPRELDRFLARSRTIGPILAGAFNVAVIGGFIVAATKIPGLIEDMVEGFTHWKRDAEETNRAQGELNKTLLDSQRILKQFGHDLSTMGLSGAPLFAQQMKNLAPDLEAASKKLSDFRDEQERLQKVKDKMFRPGGVTPLAPVLDPEAVAARARLKELALAIPEQQGRVDALGVAYLELDVRQRAAFGKPNQDAIAETTARIKEQQDAIRFIEPPRVPTLLRPDEEFFDRKAAMQGLKDFEEYEKNTNELIDHAGRERNEQFERDNRDLLRQQEDAARDFAAARRDMAGQIAGLFDDITSGSIGRAFLGQFKRLVAQMVATWVMGQQAMSAVSGGARAGGAGVREVLGNVFGGGFGGPGATPPFISTSDPTWSFTPEERRMAGLPLSAGQGAVAGGSLPAGAATVGPGGVSGAASAGILSRLGGLVPSLFAMGGLQAARSIGFGSPLRGAISGAAGAFAAGGILSTMLPFSALSLAMPLLLPFAGIGALIGVFGNSKRARQRHELHLQMFQQLRQIEDQYKFFGIDYNSARGQLEQMREEYVQAFAKLKGKRDFVDPHVDDAITIINRTEMERQRRAALQFGPPQFHAGGFVGPLRVPLHFARGGEVPAILHQGEFVMRPEAVRQQGRAKLERMNEGRDGGGSVVNNYNISMIDTRGFEDFLKRKGWSSIQHVAELMRREGR